MGRLRVVFAFIWTALIGSVAHAEMSDLALRIAMGDNVTHEMMCEDSEILSMVEPHKLAVDVEEEKDNLETHFYVTFEYDSSRVLRCLFAKKLTLLSHDSVKKSRSRFVSGLNGRLKTAIQLRRFVSLMGAYRCEDADFIKVTEFTIQKHMQENEFDSLGPEDIFEEP